MSNSTLIRPALKTQVQAPELALYRVKIADGDQRPYSQPVKQNILFYRLQIRALISVLPVANKGADLRDKRPDP
jgi:hypothetical protein